jgi:hypothetical protein
MTNTDRADRIAAEADERVAGWPSMTAEERAELTTSGVVRKLESGGFLVDVGEAFPVWRADMGAVRRLLLELDLRADASTARS